MASRAAWPWPRSREFLRPVAITGLVELQRVFRLPPLIALLLVVFDAAHAQTVFANRAALLTARDAWCSDAAAAEVTYGHISTWDVSAVTDFSWLFCANPYVADCNTACWTFNDDVSSWQTAQVTTLEVCHATASLLLLLLSAWPLLIALA